jgi:hypothetical protein
MALFTVTGDGLPPEARGRVESQCKAIARLLSSGGESLRGGASLLAQMASAVEHADSKSMKVAGLDLVRTTKTGEVVIRELSDAAYRKPARLGERAMRWAKALGAVTGVKAVDQALGWLEWQKALKQARVDPSTSAARKLSAALQRRTLEALDEAHELDRRRAAPPPFDPKASKTKQWVRRLLGYLPGPAGDAADAMGYLAASQKLREDEPQTGISQAVTDVRDFLDLAAASNHLAADVLFKHPLTAPAGAINEAAGLATDGVVLAMDGIDAVADEADKVIDSIGDGFKALADPFPF